MPTVIALLANELEVIESVFKEFMDKHSPQVGGYYVVYKDGYKSYSPAQAFEEGYKRAN